MKLQIELEKLRLAEVDKQSNISSKTFKPFILYILTLKSQTNKKLLLRQPQWKKVRLLAILIILI